MHLCVVLLGFVASQQCSTIDVRREIRDLSDGERQTFFNAIIALSQTGGTPSAYDQLVKLHVDNRVPAHNNPVFLPWHRHFLHHFQTELRRVSPGIVVPYWDTSIDSQQPEQSELFTEAYMGGSGNQANGYCIPSGPFASMRVVVEDGNSNAQTPRCIRRSFDGGDRISPFTTSAAMQQIIDTNKDFDSFARQIERAPHALPHVNVGGQFGDFAVMSSPNDPLFWLHHGNVDYWYATWQQSGIQNNYPPGREGEALPHFTDVRVQDVFNTEAFPYCYRYAPRRSTGQALRRRSAPLNQTNLGRRAYSQDKFIQAIHEACPPSTCPGAFDRKDQHRLRVPKPIPADWISRSRLGIESVRKQEIDIAKLIFKLNSNPHYQSPEAIGNWKSFHRSRYSPNNSSFQSHNTR
ncbi:hypothetical protein DSO57_1008171 [Entomophthora muscae]|uniref:Uncharacterized protein n=1 Tax=Entomophthora muscae TaxID=34485 RepID=A0ACC2T7K2_9FUNG|nr:hypothetical protein DSO57_1008171 [Entomophthora muscae]